MLKNRTVKEYVERQIVKEHSGKQKKTPDGTNHPGLLLEALEEDSTTEPS